MLAVAAVGADTPARTSAVAQLADLAARKACGELVCSSSADEIHVYLQEGRIAWASSKRQRHAFTSHLKETTGADDESIEAVVSECSRTHRPFGEALVAWKIATAEQVRASLRHQIRMALESVANAEDARTLFLERERYRYDEVLTFPLAEVQPGAPAAVATRSAPAPRAAPTEREAGAGTPPAPSPGSTAELAATDGFTAAAVLSTRGEPLAVLGDGARVAEVAALAHRLLQGGQRLAIDLGAGLCHQLHIQAEDAHLLVYSTRTSSLAPVATGPGALLRVVLVLRDLRNLASFKQRIDAVAAGLAADRTI